MQNIHYTYNPVLQLAITFNFEIFSNGEKWVELILRHIHLSMVHEAQHRLHVRVADAAQVDDRVPAAPSPAAVWQLAAQKIAEEWWTCAENHLVRLNNWNMLLILLFI